MEKIVKNFYRSYGRYINSFRAFPYIIDGLKPVERRLLLSVYEIARDKFVKSARIDGHCLGHYHPHGSSYSSLVQLVHQGFVDGQGNWGTNVGIEDTPAAAMRYTEARLNKKIQTIAFSYIDYVPMEESELDKEPKFLATMFPFCLMGREYTVGIGFGYRTFIPCYKIQDLFQRLLWLIGERKTRPTIRPVSDCDIISSESDLEQLLTKGKATIKVRGKYEIDAAKARITLYSWPYGRRFETFLNKLSAFLNRKDIGYLDESTTSTKITFQVIRQRNKSEILESLVKTLDSILEGSIQFECYVVDEDKKNIKLVSPDEMLLTCYSIFKEHSKMYLEDQISKINEQIRELDIIEKIRPYISEVSSSISDQNLAIQALCQKSGCSEDDIKLVISKHRIMKILTLSTDSGELVAKRDNFSTKLGNLNSFVLDLYKTIL